MSQPCIASRTTASSAIDPITRRASALTFSRNPVSRSSSTVTSCCRATSASTMCEPMKPAPPSPGLSLGRAHRAETLALSSYLGETAVQRVERRSRRGVDRACTRGHAVVDRRVGDDTAERDRDHAPARLRRSRSARAHKGVGSNGAPSSLIAASVASTAPTRPSLDTARPIVRRPSRIRCTSSSSVSGNDEHRERVAPGASRSRARLGNRSAPESGTGSGSGSGSGVTTGDIGLGRDRGVGGRDVDDGRRRGNGGRARDGAPANDLDRGPLVDVPGDDARRLDRHRVLGGVDPVADVQLHEQHVVALVEAGGLDARQLAQLELEIVERVHP